MDAAGAERLRWRIEQQEHWRQAASVHDGRQPRTDPDIEQLERIDDGIRIYDTRVMHGALVRSCKRLVDGLWINGTLTEAPVEAPAHVDAGHIAHVA